MRLRGSCCCAVAGLFAGCAVGPNYKRPVINSPAAFRGEEKSTNSPSTELAWWKVYEDAALQALIREAFTNNYDLRIAVARVEQARAVAMQARSQFVPSVDYNGTVSRGRNDFLGSAFPENGATVSSVSATLNAFWEVDLWGRIRRLNESARAQFLASEEARRGVRLSLLSDVATAYFQLLELDQELEIASRTTNSFAESLQNFQPARGGRHRVGPGNPRAPKLPWRMPRRRFRPSAIEFRPPRINSVSCWAATPGRSSARLSLLDANACRTFRPDCPPRCWNAGRTCGRPSSSCAPPTRKSASRSPSSFPRSG